MIIYYYNGCEGLKYLIILFSYIVLHDLLIFWHMMLWCYITSLVNMTHDRLITWLIIITFYGDLTVISCTPWDHIPVSCMFLLLLYSC